MSASDYGKVLVVIGVALAVMASGAAFAQSQEVEEYYKGNVGNGDLWATSGATVTFNTNSGIMSTAGGSGGAEPSFGFADSVAGDVQVFRFRNVNIASGVTVNVSGSRPMVLAADRDMYIASSISVSGSEDGRGGGGIGGLAGGGGSGGAGGSNSGTGGSRGAGGGGGERGGSISDDGSRGTRGEGGGQGGTGEKGTAGSGGTVGAAGTNGFGISGSGPAGGSGGEAGKDAGGGGSAGADGQGAGAPGKGGSAGWGSGSDGGNGSTGASGGGGGDAQAGESADNGSTGTNASYPSAATANTLAIFAGIGGGGGGGGGGGQGGGQGGGGGGGQGGGGGGGGGVGLQGGAKGGDGGDGGRGGAGGEGGRGGAGGAGGDGGDGGNGGGAIVLSARGLLKVTDDCQVNISAGPISQGTAGESPEGPGGLNAGASGAGGAGGQSGKCAIFGTVCGGDGGNGGKGGDGGDGGLGAQGGQGGQGGNGGYGTPGMLKLHGSIIQATDMDLLAGNPQPGGDPEVNGRLTLISNMTSQAATENQPDLTPDTILVANRVRNTDIRGNTDYDAQDTHPFLPGLLVGTGPSGSELTEGIVRKGDPNIPDYYLRDFVEDLTANPPEFELGEGTGIVGQVISGAENLFEDYEQVFILNTSEDDFTNLFLQVGTNTPAKIRGGLGELNAGEVWTTTIPAGADVRLLQAPAIIEQPQDVTVFPGANPEMIVGVEDNSETELNYQWESNRTNVWEPMVEDPSPPNGVQGTFLFDTEVTSQTLEFIDVQDVEPSVEGLYRVRVWNATGEENAVISREVRLAIYGPPEIIGEPEDVRLFPSSTHVMTVEALGFGLNYEWFYAENQDPVNPTPGTFHSIGNERSWFQSVKPGFLEDSFGNPLVENEFSDSLFFADLANVHEGFYKCVVSNPSGIVESREAFLEIESKPEIIQQPQNVTVPVGNTAVFEIETRGTVNSWEWEGFVPDSEGSGGTWETYSTQTSSDGPDLVIANAQPGQWDGTEPDDPSDPEDTIPDEGLYRCVVNGAGFVISNEVTLTVGDPGILDQPDSIQVNSGTNLDTPSDPAFEVVADTAHPPLTYTWFKEGEGGSSDIVVSGPQSEPYLLLSNILQEDEGNYYVRVTNNAPTPDSIESDRAELDVNDPPVIISQPEDVFSSVAALVELRVTASSSFAMTYEWQYQPLDADPDNGAEWEDIDDDRDGEIQGILTTAPNGEHTRVLQIQPTIASDEGRYRCQVSSSGVGSVVSDHARVILGDLLELTEWQPQGVNKVYVNRVLLRMTTSTEGGLGDRTYQWLVDREDGNGFVPASDAIVTDADPFTAPLEIINVQPDDDGIYKCVVTDERGGDEGEVTTEEIDVQVFEHMSQVELNGGTEEVTVTEDESFTFSADFTGGIAPYTYEWTRIVPETKAEEVVEITTVPEFTIEAAMPEDAGEYFVRVADTGTVINADPPPSGTSDVRNSNTVNLVVEPGIPASSVLGLVGLAGFAALGGATGLRRWRRKR
ncbi:MAG: hypothetical protein ACLFTT_04810 [Candidatus Hydrogenedentota bacterium]